MNVFSRFFGSSDNLSAQTPVVVPQPTFRELLGARIRYLREKVFQVVPRKFAYRFNFTVTELEAFETGMAEAPQELVQSLISDYLVWETISTLGWKSVARYFAPILQTASRCPP